MSHNWHSSSEHNNNMLPLTNALLFSIPTSILSTSADHNCQKYWQQAASIASRATCKLLQYALLQIQLHWANGLGQQIIDVIGTLSHPSFFCFCWHHTGDVMCTTIGTRAVNSITRSSSSKRQCPINHPWPSLSTSGMPHLHHASHHLPSPQLLAEDG